MEVFLPAGIDLIVHARQKPPPGSAEKPAWESVLQFMQCLQEHYRWGCCCLPSRQAATEKVPLNLTEVILAQGSMFQMP